MDAENRSSRVHIFRECSSLHQGHIFLLFHPAINYAIQFLFKQLLCFWSLTCLKMVLFTLASCWALLAISLPFFLMVLFSLCMHFINTFTKSSPPLGSRILWINKLILSKIKNHLSGWFWFLWLAYSSVVLIVYLYVSVKFIFFILLHYVCPSFSITFCMV